VDEDPRACPYRQHQRQLRPVDEETGGHLRRAGLQERLLRMDFGSPVTGRMEKIVPIETLVSMLEEPSSGSIASASGLAGSIRIGRCFPPNRKAQQAPDGWPRENAVGHDIEILLDIAIGVFTAARGCKAGIERALGRQLAHLESRLAPTRRWWPRQLHCAVSGQMILNARMRAAIDLTLRRLLPEPQ
jgi:hypothetical protein